MLAQSQAAPRRASTANKPKRMRNRNIRRPGSRKRADGLAIEWTTAKLGPGPSGSVLPFLIEDKTPHEWRVQPSASVKESGLTGVGAVVIGVSDLSNAVSAFRRAFGWAEPIMESHKEFEAKLAYFPGTPVILAAPEGGKSWLSDRLQKFGDAPVAYLIQARDVPAAVKKFHLSAVKNSWFGQKIAWVDAAKLKGIRVGVIGQ